MDTSIVRAGLAGAVTARAQAQAGGPRCRVPGPGHEASSHRPQALARHRDIVVSAQAPSI